MSVFQQRALATEQPGHGPRLLRALGGAAHLLPRCLLRPRAAHSPDTPPRAQRLPWGERRRCAGAAARADSSGAAGAALRQATGTLLPGPRLSPHSLRLAARAPRPLTWLAMPLPGLCGSSRL